MSLTQAAPLLTPEEIAVRAGGQQQVPFLVLPQRASVFAEREIRLRQLAAGHPMRDFLIFMAEVVHAQHRALQDCPAVEVPDDAALESAARVGMPAVPATDWPRDPAWRAVFRSLLDSLVPRLAGSPALATVQALREVDDEWLDAQADLLLHNLMLGLELGPAPLIGAALQVYWTHLVLSTQAAGEKSRLAPFGRTDDATACPCCGSHPTASVSRVNATAGNYRYLHCSLCSTQWHMVRIKCSHCEGTKGIQYQSLEPVGAATAEGNRAVKHPVEAETCDECGHYLKIVHMERDAQVEPVADDLASVTLDLLVSEAGFQRHGVNLMLLFGEPDIPDDGGGG
ncbi:formate dehydrogenase accessory protein FdhE [Variovorax sp. dw_954]|uniref:formate dehydrogenase accessory protein FdhE n=1 Tax=Variovorax sp. dw_954 TaxID=2720078 RepID=UPI001BD2CEA7|nr:formate dehydrogenase accessory protein FdhE [Variovorax sp. dw_954]